MQFDPALRELLLSRTGSPEGEEIPEDVAHEEIPVVVRLRDPAATVEPLVVVSRFGHVVTGRALFAEIVTLRRHPNVASLKLSRVYSPHLEYSLPEIRGTQVRLRTRIPMSITGRGVVLGLCDWGLDFFHRNFMTESGATRLLYLWDQRGSRQTKSPSPFGYGREFARAEINKALATSDPYATLGYDPAQSDPQGIGTHGTHVADIAAGNGSAPGSSPGVAPNSSIIFVHLKQNDVRPQDTLGDSVRLLEGIDYIVRRAGGRPVVINLSLGRTGGPHDGTTLLERALDGLLSARPRTAVVMSTGNYYGAGLHAAGVLQGGQRTDLHWQVSPRHDETAELEVWYPGSDEFAVELIDPYGRALALARLGENRVVRDRERVLASVYHRQRDPNNGDHQIDCFLGAHAPIGTWTVRLHGLKVRDGRYSAWIERDDVESQSRFAPECASEHTTIGSICCGRLTIAVGAYDARDPSHPLVPFTSSGPTRDGRQRPVVSAPGAGILAARSCRLLPFGRTRDELTVKSGSSMAAPHVSGTIALMFEAAGERLLHASDVRDILVRSARQSPPVRAREYLRYGAGRLDAAAAIEEVLSRNVSRAAPLSAAERALAANHSIAGAEAGCEL